MRLPRRVRCRSAGPRIRSRRSRASRRPIAQDAQGSIGPFGPSICRIDWQAITSAPSGALPPVTACPYCGRANDPGAQFCMDCGKPMTKPTGRKAAAGSAGGGETAAGAGRAGELPGTRAVLRATVASAEAISCPFCGARASGRQPFCPQCGRRLTAPSSGPNCPRCASPVEPGIKFCATCGAPLVDVAAARRGLSGPSRAGATIALVLLRDLGSRNGTWVFLEAAHRLLDGDLLLIGSQVIRFRRLGYPGPLLPDAEATKRMGSLIPSADIASLTQLRSDGSARDVVQLSPGRDIQIGRERGEWIFPYDPSMSATHVTIRSEDADFVVVDAGSRNGVAIAARGDMAVLHHSRILVGDKLLRIE